MAYITYIIGNGLDLSLGLKTSYRDFYEYVDLHRLHSENRIYKAIADSPESWADFELALGRYTDYIDKLPEKDKKPESVKFHDELEDLRDDLADYLEKQELSIYDQVVGLSMTHNGYFNELPFSQKDRVSAIANQGQTVFQYISLNYTKTLEVVLGNSAVHFNAYNIRSTDPHHIHGDLAENLTLGVSDDTQLSASMSDTEKDDLIKPSLIYSMNDGRIDTLKQIIQSSSVIVLFGTSIGETDKYIWQIITEWLSLNSQRHVVIHKHDDEYTDGVKRSSRKRKQFDGRVQEKLLRFSGQDGDGIAGLKNQVLVVHNTKSLFVE